MTAVNEFLSTPSARRATLASRSFCTSALNFYPRPPRGGRRKVEGGVTTAIQISIHALREEGDTVLRAASMRGLDFYPRPPRGGRPLPA